MANGSKLLPGVDARSAEARRFKSFVSAFTIELGRAPTESERERIRAAAAMAVRIETMQGAMVRGESVDDEQLVRLVNAQSRFLRDLKPVPKPAKTAPGDALASFKAGLGKS